ncbi:MAG TPA: hypothetical protein VLM89_00685 [Phycisphaerae bacterium]|nr:hypothetical protein [Phycisphaerae bacterium]
MDVLTGVAKGACKKRIPSNNNRYRFSTGGGCGQADRRQFRAGGEGAALDMFQAGRGGELTRVASVKTAPYARTGLSVADRRAVYLAVPPQKNRDSGIREYKVPD